MGSKHRLQSDRQGCGCALTLTNAGASAAYAERVRDRWARILDGLLPAYEGRHAAGWA